MVLNLRRQLPAVPARGEGLGLPPTACPGPDCESQLAQTKDAVPTREDGNQMPSTRAKMETNTLEIKTDIYPHTREDGNKDV